MICFFWTIFQPDDKLSAQPLRMLRKLSQFKISLSTIIRALNICTHIQKTQGNARKSMFLQNDIGYHILKTKTKHSGTQKITEGIFKSQRK